MKMHKFFLIASCFWLSVSCSPSAKNNEAQTDGAENENNNIDNDLSNFEVIDANQQLTIEEGNALPTINVGGEVDVGNLPPDMLLELNGMAKIAKDKIIFYANNNQSWLLDDSSPGELQLISSKTISQAESKNFVLENGGYWQVSKARVALYLNGNEDSQDKEQIFEISPKLELDSEEGLRVLFVGPDTLLLTDDNSLNIIQHRDGINRLVYLDLPASKNSQYTIIGAGKGSRDREYWFLSSSSLLILSHNNQGWRWKVYDFTLKILALDSLAQLTNLALITDFDEDGELKFLGRSLFQADSLIFGRELGLMLTAVEPDIANAFKNEIQAIFTNRCADCHSTYNQLGVAVANAAQFKVLIENDQMPQDSPLVEPERSKVIQWLDAVLNRNP